MSAFRSSRHESPWCVDDTFLRGGSTNVNSSAFRMPANRRRAAVRAVSAAVSACALAAPVALAGPAHATGGGADGSASAAVLRAGLDVSLLGDTVRVPLRTSLNEVSAPGSADRTALSVRLDGVDRGRPFQLLRADAATARAHAGRKGAEGYANLVKARVHLPGLPLLSLVEVEKVTSRAVCTPGRKPVAESNLLGPVTVLGKKVTLTASGTTRVEVPGVGEVNLELSRTATTGRSAAATALVLNVSVDPLRLNVARVSGRVALVEAQCRTPRTALTERPEQPEVPEQPGQPERPEPPARPEQPEQRSGEEAPGTGVRPQGGDPAPTEALAETGGSATTLYLAGGAVLLLGLGGGALVLTRARARARG
jgi:hypothetical protein